MAELIHQAHSRFALLFLGTFLVSNQLDAENRLTLARTSGNVIKIELTNTDSIAGGQFRLNARGGITMGTYATSVRAGDAGLEIYQHNIDDSTLAVVLLAPYGRTLGPGAGAIGEITISSSQGNTNGSVRMFVTDLSICDIDAQGLAITAEELTWQSDKDPNNRTPGFAFDQNYPNPFNPTTTISYVLPARSQVRVAVYNNLGQEVARLVNSEQSAGRNNIVWNAKEPSGLYYCRIEALSLADGNRFVDVRKMLLLK